MRRQHNQHYILRRQLNFKGDWSGPINLLENWCLKKSIAKQKFMFDNSSLDGHRTNKVPAQNSNCILYMSGMT